MTQADFVTPEQLINLNERYDLAIVANCLEHMNMADGQTLLGRLRNLIAPHIWLLVEKDCWPNNALLGMGFRLDNAFDNRSNLKSYSYNLNSYNFKREWNNAKKWANPENWGKYWW